mmetsp:Transcript_36702/g.60086  ORF Transcript_36702/g.60086 Transcript_36702/m.60086 type:complete len:304 (+) Transcript_36702:569-1480(+)
MEAPKQGGGGRRRGRLGALRGAAPGRAAAAARHAALPAGGAHAAAAAPDEPGGRAGRGGSPGQGGGGAGGPVRRPGAAHGRAAAHAPAALAAPAQDQLAPGGPGEEGRGRGHRRLRGGPAGQEHPALQTVAGEQRLLLQREADGGRALPAAAADADDDRGDLDGLLRAGGRAPGVALPAGGGRADGRLRGLPPRHRPARPRDHPPAPALPAGGVNAPGDEGENELLSHLPHCAPAAHKALPALQQLHPNLRPPLPVDRQLHRPAQLPFFLLVPYEYHCQLCLRSGNECKLLDSAPHRHRFQVL